MTLLLLLVSPLLVTTTEIPINSSCPNIPDPEPQDKVSEFYEYASYRHQTQSSNLWQCPKVTVDPGRNLLIQEPCETGICVRKELPLDPKNPQDMKYRLYSHNDLFLVYGCRPLLEGNEVHLIFGATFKDISPESKNFNIQYWNVRLNLSIDLESIFYENCGPKRSEVQRSRTPMKEKKEIPAEKLPWYVYVVIGLGYVLVLRFIVCV